MERLRKADWCSRRRQRVPEIFLSSGQVFITEDGF